MTSENQKRPSDFGKSLPTACRVFQRDHSPLRLLFSQGILLAALFFTSCSIPPRTGYDRNIGDWKKPSSGKAQDKTAHATDASLDDIIRPWLGTPYKYGGQSKSGTDCSGFVQNVMRDYKGITLPRNAAAAYKLGKEVDRSDLRTGDVVFFGTFWGIDHTGIWIGNGSFVHASTSSGVITTQLDSDPYWSKRFRGGRRYE
ncbi:MAG TPA: NlpC/P60 family protein [Fibrobacteraceae bacterium]|nr:NlpC/P60 family protein [Fibrobacteraceae bacterium]